MVIGVKDNSYYIIEEHAAQHKYIDGWKAVARDIIKRFGNIPFYCDPARPEHIAAFQLADIGAFPGNNRVLSGIEAIATLMKNQMFFICLLYTSPGNIQILDSKSGWPILAARGSG